MPTPTPSDTPTETTTPPTTEGGDGDVPVPPSTAPPESLIPAAEPEQTRLRAQFRVSGAGASAATMNTEETRNAFLDALAAGSSSPALPRSSLSVLRVAPVYVPLQSDSKKRRRRTLRRRALLLFDAIDDTSDVLVEVDASGLGAAPGGPPRAAGAQAAFDSVRNAAYSGLAQTSLLRGTGRRWAVVLTYAAAAAPGDELLPPPDDACEHRFSRSSCLDGTGLTPAAAKGIIASGVMVVLLALAFAGVAWDRRARAVGFGGGGSGGGGGGGTGKMADLAGSGGGGGTGKMADLAGSPRAAAAAAGLTAIPLPSRAASAAAAPGAALAIGGAGASSSSSSSSSSGPVAGALSSSPSGRIKAGR